jgi:hypothetical protein
MKNLWKTFKAARPLTKAGLLIGVAVLLAGCGGLSKPTDWTRRDMPTDGNKQVVTYNLDGPATSDSQSNTASLRGLNGDAPTLEQQAIFNQMSGSKTQDIQETLPNGNVYQGLGMVKTQRYAGLTHYLSVESATYSGVDSHGLAVCGAKIRLDFNRNFIQYFHDNQRDYDSLWYYDIPCQKTEQGGFSLDIEHGKLRAVVLNQVWQARIASGSHFYNWGHSVTIVGGPMAHLKPGWWTHWDFPGASDTIGAAGLANDAVRSLESSSKPWVDFKSGDKFDAAGAYLIYSAGDADQYATFNRFFLNRQNQYSVLYRPNKATAWDWITVKPVYNVEWNDVWQNLKAIHGWTDSTLKDHLDKSGMPKTADDSVVKEIERQGWMNAPNASLEQIQFIDRHDKIVYAMTVRAFIGAADTLVMFGKVAPDLTKVQAELKQYPNVNFPKPVLYDGNGKKIDQADQPYTDKQWAEWQREATMWNWLRDNPYAVKADLEMQYRFKDNSTWGADYCSDSNSNTYICGYHPVEWNLSTSYYFDQSADQVRKPWAIMNLLGEVGVRTLGLTYASGLYSGTGTLFAMSQLVQRDAFFKGYKQEDIWDLDARAMQLPDTMAEAWSSLHAK